VGQGRDAACDRMSRGVTRMRSVPRERERSISGGVIHKMIV
jgi:hypothetical protein